MFIWEKFLGDRLARLLIEKIPRETANNCNDLLPHKYGKIVLPQMFAFVRGTLSRVSNSVHRKQILRGMKVKT